MTNTQSTQDIANEFAARFASLDEFDVADMHSDEGLVVDGHAVWHREEDDKIVTFTDSDDGEQWGEAPVIR